MRRSILLVILFVVAYNPVAFSQADRREVRQGNKLYRAEKFDEAEIHYRRALEKNPENLTGLFNLGNSLYKQGRYEEAAEIFEALSQVLTRTPDRAQAFHNLGNSQLKANKIQESIEAYKNSIRLNPADNETRHNLAYALKLLEDPPPQDGDGEGHDNDEQKDQKDQDSGQDENEQEQENQPEQQPQPDQISPQDAERMLNALNQQEQEVHENLNKVQPQRTERKIEREW